MNLKYVSLSSFLGQLWTVDSNKGPKLLNNAENPSWTYSDKKWILPVLDEEDGGIVEDSETGMVLTDNADNTVSLKSKEIFEKQKWVKEDSADGFMLEFFKMI